MATLSVTDSSMSVPTSTSMSSSSSSTLPLLRIRVSEVADLLGMNPYKSPQESIRYLRYRFFSQIGGYEYITNPREIFDQAVAFYRPIARAIMHFRLKETQNREIERYQKALQRNKYAKELADAFQYCLNTQKGINGEKMVIDMLKKRHIEIKGNNAFLYTYPLSTCLINGYVDGFTYYPDGVCRLVEIKCRVSRVFSIIPIYEYVQINILMHLTHCKECYWVQFGEGKIVIQKHFYNGSFTKYLFQRLEEIAYVAQCNDNDRFESLLAELFPKK